jgi:hypothetical protein
VKPGLRSIRLLAVTLLVLCFAPGCAFDRGGLSVFDAGAHDSRADGPSGDAPANPSDGPSLFDSAAFDLAQEAATLADQSLPLDQTTPLDQPIPTDQALPLDQALPADTTIIVPIDAATLGQAFSSTTVACVDMQGNTNGTQTPVADSAKLTFFDGAVTLANAPAALKGWAGGKSTVTIMWDPNGCDDEWPLSGSTSWGQAGLLIRGASLDSSGRLVLEPGVTASSINLLDVYGDGGYEQEVFGIDDAGLASHPPLIQGVNAAKQLILTLGGL